MADRQFYARIKDGSDTATAHDGEVAAVLELVTVARPGYLPLVTVGAGKPAEVPAGKRIVRTFRRTETAIERTYALDDAPPRPPRRWSRLTVKGALADAHLLPAARAFLSAYEIKPDYPALEAFSDCDYIEEFYGGAEKWNQLLDGAAQALGKTRAEVDAFLDSLPEETAS